MSDVMLLRTGSKCKRKKGTFTHRACSIENRTMRNCRSETHDFDGTVDQDTPAADRRHIAKLSTLGTLILNIAQQHQSPAAALSVDPTAVAPDTAKPCVGCPTSRQCSAQIPVPNSPMLACIDRSIDSLQGRCSWLTTKQRLAAQKKTEVKTTSKSLRKIEKKKNNSS